MKVLLIATAAIEAATGVALVVWPSELIAVLLGSSLGAPAGLTVARVAGVALLSLGVRVLVCARGRAKPRRGRAGRRNAAL